MSYFDERIHKELELSVDDYTIDIDIKTMHSVKRQPFQFLKENKYGGIDIYFYNLNRDLIEYNHPKADLMDASNIYNERVQTFILTRLHPDQVTDVRKYDYPRGAGVHPFIPPQVVDKFEKKENIHTLYLTEGAFKALKAAKHGVDVVGLTSISHYANSTDKRIHKDIQRIILECNVKNVVMVYDADCLQISEKDLERKEELTRRPLQFYNSMIAIKNLLTEFNVNVYFCHVLEECGPKGLDDLYVANKGREDAITKDLFKLTSSEYFYKLNLNSYLRKLNSYFNLKNVHYFYVAHANKIENRKFQFFGNLYQYNSEDDKIEVLRDKRLKNLFICADDYYELANIPVDESGTYEEQLLLRKKEGIIRDYGKESIDTLPVYKKFVNVPSHINYQKIIGNCYNLYHKIIHEPQQGEFPITKKFLQHIFRDKIDVGMDYLTIMYRYPKQILPILCLVSEKRGTGKSTFLKWLNDIYGENVAIIGNDEFKSQFNGIFMSKLVVGIDETSLADNREITERLKMLSTSEKVHSQLKGKDFRSEIHFAKYILCSNKVNNFIYTDENEVRFFILELDSFEEEGERENPNIKKDMYDEIPAFLHYLSNRKIINPKMTRAWFDYSLIRTQAFDNLVENQKPKCQKLITEWLIEMFESFDLDEIIVNAKVLLYFIPQLKKYESQINDSIKRLDGEQVLKDGKSTAIRFKIPQHSIFNDETIVTYESFVGRGFKFYKKDFCHE